MAYPQLRQWWAVGTAQARNLAKCAKFIEFSGNHAHPERPECRRMSNSAGPLIRKGGHPACGLGVVARCRVLLPRDVYESAPMAMIAAHESLLPAYRGFAPLNWTIINGEDRTGTTVFYVAERMDAGDIVCQKTVPIAAQDAPRYEAGGADAT